MRGEISSARFFRMGKSDWRKAFAPERTAMPCSMRKARIWLIVAVRLATSLGSDAVAGLQVELILRLLGHAAQVRAQGRLRDGLGIVVVVLLPLDERLHVDGRNDPRLVAEGAQGAADKVGAQARFHADHAGGSFLKVSVRASRLILRRK